MLTIVDYGAPIHVLYEYEYEWHKESMQSKL